MVQRVNNEETEMATQVFATVIDGVLRPDEELKIPDQTRVSLIIEPIRTRRTPAEALKALKERIRKRPINAAGLHFTRDELHERR